jgi:ribonucleotide reductase alpha subunit
MITPATKRIDFKLCKETLDEIYNFQTDWSENTIGLVTLYRTYLRNKPDGTLETWNDCVVRVIEGMFTIQKTHIVNNLLMWDEERAQKTAKDAALRLLQFKWTPPGRGLWMMGTDFVFERGGACLNNCAFVSTENIDKEGSEPFRFLMDSSMLGVGVGFDTNGAGKIKIVQPDYSNPVEFVVEDTRESWVESIGTLIDSFIFGGSDISINTSKVRKYGEPIKGFGGVASGEVPLIQGFYGIKDILTKRIGQFITSSDIVDIQNLIGKIVISGNVRRTAEIALGKANDQEFRELKSWDKFGVETGAELPIELKEKSKEDYEFLLKNRSTPEGKALIEKYKDERWAYKFGGWRWASNNSIVISPGADYSEIAKAIAENGEPGLFFLDNARNYSRMIDPPDYKDHRVTGTNPCVSGDSLISISTDGKSIQTISIRELNDLYYSNGVLPEIISYDIESGETCFDKIEWVGLTRQSAAVVEVELEDGKILKCTPDHKIFTKNRGYIQAKDLSIEDELISAKLRKTIFDIEPEDVYDITVAKNHNFFANGILVHNCGEQSLESYEMCCLVETFPSHHTSAKDFYDTLKIAYLYAKTVTLVATHYPKTNIVMSRNRRIGCSQSGIVEAIARHGRHYYQKNMLDGAYHKICDYDKIYSEWLGVPLSLKKSSIKPSGSVSLVANITGPGGHFPKVRYGYRTMRMSKDSPIIQILRDANYRIENSVTDSSKTVVVYFPIIGKENVPTDDEVTIWEKFINASMLQRFWADNQVSVTISFKPEEAKDISKCLSAFENDLKAVSLMPLNDHGYEQAPYIHTTKDEVLSYKKSLLPVDFSVLHTVMKAGENESANKYCDGDSCVI